MATAGAAAAIAAGVVVTHSSVRVTGQAVRPPGVALPAQLTAKQVLARAAAAALREAVVVPRGDQFVYTKVQAGGQVTRTWLSVDGSRNGLVKGYFEGGNGTTTILGCRNGERRVRIPAAKAKLFRDGPKPVKTPVPMDGPVVTEPCTPTPAYFPDMPTSATAMGTYLQRTQGTRPGDLNDLSKVVGGMLESDYILPAQRAALYRYLATTPGLTVEPHVRDVSGRPGIGVVWRFQGAKAMNIFDPRTFAYLGMTTWGIRGELGGGALLQTAIVDHPGQLPR